MSYKSLIFFLFIIRVSAQDIRNETIEIQEIVVVTTTRSERLLKDMPITTSVISSKSIEKSKISNFKEFLEQELGGITFSNHSGSSTINVMGLEAKYVLFLVDGDRLAGETFNNIDYNRININNIERIEFVKGATSSLYGSNAIGGVINIITKKPKKDLEVNISARYGSFEEQNTNIYVGTKQEWGSVSLSSFYKNRIPYLLKDKYPLTQIYEDGKLEFQPLEETYIAGYSDFGIAPKASINISPNIELNLNSNFYFKERNQGGGDAKKIREQYADYSNSAKLNIQFPENKNLNVSGSYAIYHKFDHFRILKQKNKKYENSIWRASAIYDQKLFKKHSLLLGGEFLSEQLLSFMFNTNGAEAKKNAQTYSFFFQQEWSWVNAFILVIGGRYDYHSEYKGHFSWRFSGMQKLGKNITLRGGYSGGFCSPTLKELYTDWYHPYGGGFQILGNTNLKVEKSHNFNVSSDIHFDRFNFTFLGQYSYIKDKITSAWTDQTRFKLKYVNLENARIFSTEAQAKYQFNNLIIDGGYSFTYYFNKEQQLVRPHTFTTKIEYIPNLFGKYALSISFSGKYFSSLDFNGTDFIKGKYKVFYEPYSIWRLGISFKLLSSWQIDTGVDNLFDYKPSFVGTYSGISAGRTFFVGFRWNVAK